MDKPQKLVLDDRSSFRNGCSGALVGLGIMGLATVIVLTQSYATLRDLVLPMGILNFFWLFWMMVNFIIGLFHRFRDRRRIERIFEAGIWQYWRYRSDEWHEITEAECEKICPEEGPSAFLGAVYSSIFGLVISVIMVLVGIFVIKDEQMMPAINISAGAVFLLLLGVGLFQPLQARFKAQRFRWNAQRTLEPRAWFGSEGVYHEVFGYTSLRELNKISHSKRKKTIRFNLGSEYTYQFEISVPSGYEHQAAQLVKRYRQELVGDWLS
jgi:hypothetical protein